MFVPFAHLLKPLLLALPLIALWTPAYAAEPKSDPLAGLRPKHAESDQNSVEPSPDGKARTAFFGLPGTGFKFVYVLDRSASMGGSGREALRRVKVEMEKSLRPLDTVHQFQIIFYNDEPVIFNPSGVAGRLAFANPQTKERAIRFVNSIIPDGNTDHERALKLAIRLRPDVIFFLTDGDEPKLSRRQLDEINRLAGGITVNVVEFGSGPRASEGSFLEILATENSGEYRYIDIRSE